MKNPPNVLFILADQLRASSLPVYGEEQIDTPNLSRLAREGVLFSNAISTCPVCTPYRSMLLTGRHPQTTGHLFNFVNTRHDEIGIGDAFARAGYRTGWVGKWHLHRGAYPQNTGPDHVPLGRDRLGFQYWRGYNFHMDYFDGTVNRDDWKFEKWQGYETDALKRYALEFLESRQSDPFCLFVSPHQPHWTPKQFVPESYYDRVPSKLSLPANVSPHLREASIEAYRHYLAMTLAVDDMVGDLLTCLKARNLLDSTIVVFTSDHGTQMGAHGVAPWDKKVPYEESLRVPLLIRHPEYFAAGSTCESLTAPVDIFPSLCTLCGVPVPQTVEGMDLSQAWQAKKNAPEQEAILTMNFSAALNLLKDGKEYRGVRTRTTSYTRWLNGSRELYNLQEDPLQECNLIGQDGSQALEEEMEHHLVNLMAQRNDSLTNSTACRDWYDSQRRVIKNAFGPLPHPEQDPNWSLLPG